MGKRRPTPSPSRNGGEFYGLQGRRLQKAPQKGLYIQNGKIYRSTEPIVMKEEAD